MERMTFSSASTRTAPTQNLVDAGGERRARSRAYSIYALWSPAEMVGWGGSEAIVDTIIVKMFWTCTFFDMES